VVRGETHLESDLGCGSSGDAEWLALLHALDVAAGAGVVDAVLLGDSASVIDQAKGIARRRIAPDMEVRFEALSRRFERLRFRRIKRSQNLAGIALEQVHRRSPQ
jgi:ribonuclease HI